MRRLLSSRIGHFFVFLMTPEDSSTGGGHQYRHPQAAFDNHLCGAIKIVFWIAVVVMFWSILPLLRCVFCR